MSRNRRAGVEDLWHRTRAPKQSGTLCADHKKPHTALHGKGLRWRARYVDGVGQEYTRRFRVKAEAEVWLSAQSSSVETGTHVAPRDAQQTVARWCETWLAGYKIHRASTIKIARSHLKVIQDEFGGLPLASLRPTMVKAWLAKLKARGCSDAYVYALHSRLSQILADAVTDGVLAKNPCSRQTSPKAGRQKPYVATTEQVWAFHDAMPDHLRSAVLLGAFAGLRLSEAVGLRVADVDFVRGVVHPKQQEGGRPLKTESSDAPVPIPRELTLLLSASVKRFRGENLVCNLLGESVSAQTLGWHVRQVRSTVAGLPETFTFHDLRHFYASLLISKGADIKTVQARLRHSSAVTTLGCYAHLWPDADETTRMAIGSVLAERSGSSAYSLRTGDATEPTGSQKVN